MSPDTLTPRNATIYILHYAPSAIRRERLARLGLARGFGDDKTRDTAWRKITNLTLTNDMQLVSDTASPAAKQIALDAPRSCHQSLESPGFRVCTTVRQETLQEVLQSLFSRRPEWNYYQGLHDVAVTVLTVISPPRAAERMLEKIVDKYLPYVLGDKMEREQLAMQMVSDICCRSSLAYANAYNAATHDDCGFGIVNGLWALADIITFMTHGFDNPKMAQRLLDAVLSAPPAFPLYLAAASGCLECELLARTPIGRSQSPLELFNTLSKMSESKCAIGSSDISHLDITTLPITLHDAVKFWTDNEALHSGDLWIELVIRLAIATMKTYPVSSLSPKLLAQARPLLGQLAGEEQVDGRALTLATSPLDKSIAERGLVQLVTGIGSKLGKVIR